MKRFPAEFEALLSPAGRRLLKGKHPARDALLRSPFYASPDFVEVKHFPAYARLLAKTFDELLDNIERKLPAPNVALLANHDTLPKVGRMQTLTVFDGAHPDVELERAKDIGLHQMMRSPSFLAFCEALAGERLDGPQAVQVMSFRQGDYAGPHTDHHPDVPRARNGYVDVHVTITTSGVKEQFIVYERDGHFSQAQSIAASGTVTAYRLPVWHYTTPLIARSKKDRRWLLLGSTLLHSTRGLPDGPRPNKSTEFEAALEKVMLRVSSLAPSTAPSASEEPPPSS